MKINFILEGSIDEVEKAYAIFGDERRKIYREGEKISAGSKGFRLNSRASVFIFENSNPAEASIVMTLFVMRYKLFLKQSVSYKFFDVIIENGFMSSDLLLSTELIEEMRLCDVQFEFDITRY